jgi:hypothetical protein
MDVMGSWQMSDKGGISVEDDFQEAVSQSLLVRLTTALLGMKQKRTKKCGIFGRPPCVTARPRCLKDREKGFPVVMWRPPLG